MPFLPIPPPHPSWTHYYKGHMEKTKGEGGGGGGRWVQRELSSQDFLRGHVQLRDSWMQIEKSLFFYLHLMCMF